MVVGVGGEVDADKPKTAGKVTTPSTPAEGVWSVDGEGEDGRGGRRDDDDNERSAGRVASGDGASTQVNYMGARRDGREGGAGLRGVMGGGKGGVGEGGKGGQGGWREGGGCTRRESWRARGISCRCRDFVPLSPACACFSSLPRVWRG